ncbi:hypothetical protein [Brevibacillus laterosporus]|nr:hypothetical protein [Brevibacillus laterosporus]MBM7106925.1 hypothetical protein [Brevibacillus laterosporus]MED1909790.1 hypothetical protein [Brevibacillus laterosporus]
MKKLFASSLVLFAFLLMSSMANAEGSAQLTAKKATAYSIQYSTAPDW